MRVILEKFIVADSGVMGVSGFKIGVETTVQWDRPLRATNAQPRDRGNSATSISFSVTRLFTSVAAAETFILLHGKLLPKRGMLQLIAEDGKTVQKSFMRVTAVPTVESSYIGATTMHSYKFVGGGIFSTES